MEFAGYIEFFIKMFGWCTVAISAWLVTRNVVRTTNALYSFFAKAGLPWGTALHVVMMCHKDRTNLVRMFMEYCILKVRESVLSRKEWRNIIYSYEAQYIKNLHREYVIKIENTFVLRDEVVKKRVEEYFAFLKKKKYSRLFSINSDSYLVFVADIVIDEGYVAPLVQICSLQERFNSDWSQILNHYVTEFGEGKNKFASEVSSFYTWLMWGPSVCITGSDSAYKLCLYGLGDESMAVPLVLTEKSELVWNEIKANLQSNKMGTFVSGKFRLCDSAMYIRHKYNRFDSSAVLFINKMEESENSFLLEDNGESNINQYIKSREYIFSAYIWIMLYYVVKNEEHAGFDCTRATVWFEHANIADNKNVELLTETLVNKCLSYFNKIWESGEYPERIYSIPWAINESVRDALRKAVENIRNDSEHPYQKNYLEQVNLDMADVEQNSILSNIDDEFADEEFVLKYTDIDFDNAENLGLFGRFYCELYMREFPDENERESLDNILEQARRMKSSESSSYHCIIATVGSDIVGGIIGDYFPKVNCGAVEFIVVAPDRRHQRIGTGLISNLVNFFNADAQKYIGKSHIDYYFFEVENPDKVTDANAAVKCKERLGFWNKMSAELLQIDYIQPPLEEGKLSVDYLYLAICVIDTKLSRENIDRSRVFGFLREFFAHAFDIKEPENCIEYQQMLKQVESREKLDILRISDVNGD